MTYRTIEVRPVTPAVGAEISGVDLTRDLGEETVAEIRRALLEHLVVFFRGQTLAPDHQLAFARRFGEIDRYPFVQGMASHPDIVEVVKLEHEQANFGGVWHSDTTYLGEPPMGSVLYARELPPVGGDTLFASMYLAYELLSDGMRRILDGLTAINSAAKPDAAATRTDRRAERPTGARVEVTEAEHPVVRTHPETGRKALFVNRGHTVRFAGFTAEESRPILEYLFAHQLRPELACRVRWEEGSLAFWDNRAAQHYAANDYHGHRRVMHRITLKGDRPR